MPVYETSSNHPRPERCCKRHEPLCYGDCGGGSDIQKRCAFASDCTEEGSATAEDERTDDVNDSNVPSASSLVTCDTVDLGYRRFPSK